MKIERAVGELSTSNYIMCARRWWKLNVFLHNRGSWRGKMGAGICLFQRLGNGILCTGTGIHENKKQLKNGNGISIWATQAGIVGFELGFEKKQFPGKWDWDPPFTTLLVKAYAKRNWPYRTCYGATSWNLVKSRFRVWWDWWEMKTRQIAVKTMYIQCTAVVHT